MNKNHIICPRLVLTKVYKKSIIAKLINKQSFFPCHGLTLTSSLFIHGGMKRGGMEMTKLISHTVQIISVTDLELRNCNAKVNLVSDFTFR